MGGFLYAITTQSSGNFRPNPPSSAFVTETSFKVWGGGRMASTERGVTAERALFWDRYARGGGYLGAAGRWFATHRCSARRLAS